MDSHGSFPIESVITVQALGKKWPRFGRQAAPYVRRERHHPEEREEEHLADEQDREHAKEERARDGTTRDHPDGFEIMV